MFDAFTLNQTNPYATTEELVYMVELGRRITPNKAVMLGAGPGVFAVALCDNPAYSGVAPELTIVDISTCEYTLAHLSALNNPRLRVQCIISDSAAAGLQWQGGELGLLIIDADHSTEAVLRDIDAWFPHVASGGYIFFHDFLEREGGFNGTDAWQPGPVSVALAQRKHLAWKFECVVGISAVYIKK